MLKTVRMDSRWTASLASPRSTHQLQQEYEKKEEEEEEEKGTRGALASDAGIAPPKEALTAAPTQEKERMPSRSATVALLLLLLVLLWRHLERNQVLQLYLALDERLCVHPASSRVIYVIRMRGGRRRWCPERNACAWREARRRKEPGGEGGERERRVSRAWRKQPGCAHPYAVLVPPW